MMGSRCNPVMSTSDEYIGVTSRPDVYDTICGDEAYQSLTSAMSDAMGTETVVVPSSAYDVFNIDTRIKGMGLSYGSTFDNQMAFGAERLPRPEDVVGATLDDHKVGVGFITSNSKDFPVQDIQVLRPYIPAPVSTDNWGTIGLATRGAFGQMLTDGTLLMDPRFTLPSQAMDMSGGGIYGFPTVLSAAPLGIWGEAGSAPSTNVWGAPGSSNVSVL
eukprot:jgi/Mesvir1/21636/Mv04058-RA.1